MYDGCMNESGSDRNVAILWDVENVNPNATSEMVSTITDFASRYGRVSVSFAFADWSRRNWKGSDAKLAQESFQLIHVPRARKNSSDISMVTHAMELLFLYPHISSYILVTGDTDFRPLIVSIRRRGAQSIVLCDSKNASEDLLALADSFQDYRDLLADEEADLEDERDDAKNGRTNGKDDTKLTKQRAFELLSETVSMMRESGKVRTLGPVKIRLRLLNENFDESKLGYRSWKSFVLAARDEGHVAITPTDNDLVLDIPEASQTQHFSFSEPFATLKDVVLEHTKKYGGKPVPFALVSKEMKNRNVDFHTFGYNRFKKLAEAAEKRGVIEVVRDGLDLFAKPAEN